MEGYGFIAAFVAGVTLRRFESRHAFHRRLHSFSESIEHALTAVLLVLLVLLGGALPALWPMLELELAAIGLALILFIRPLFGWLSLLNTPLRGRERLVIGFYGVRGVGSIYYLAYAGHHMELTNEASLWATVGGHRRRARRRRGGEPRRGWCA